VGIPAESVVGRRADDLFTLTTEGGSAVSIADGPGGRLLMATSTGRSLWVRVSSSATADAGAARLRSMVFVDESTQRRLEDARRLLLSSIRHELYGSLTVIRGHAQLLDTFLPDDEDGDSLGAILDAVEMMHHVVEALVAVGDPDPRARPATTAEPIDVAALLRRALRSIPSVAARTVIGSSPGRTMHGDPLGLWQCLLLAVENAEKYAPEGKITITVREVGSYGVIGIADEGPGIPAGERALALKPYYRSADVGEVPGSGMGLYIADMVMTAMGGRIELATAPSGGLQVNFWLPLSLATCRLAPPAESERVVLQNSSRRADLGIRKIVYAAL
jgi:signal transduction histidine kinase